METKHPIEAYTTAFDYLKHISSLCTGSILLIVAFLEKLFSNPEWKFLIAVSLVSFLTCIIGTIGGQAAVIEFIDKEATVAKWAKPLAGVSFATVWMFFIVGLLSLVVFALKNLY